MRLPFGNFGTPSVYSKPQIAMVGTLYHETMDHTVTQMGGTENSTVTQLQDPIIHVMQISPVPKLKSTQKIRTIYSVISTQTMLGDV